MSTSAITPDQIEGLPAGVTLRALKPQGVTGLPPGATLRQLQQPTGQIAPPPPKPEPEGFFHSLASTFNIPTNAEEAQRYAQQVVQHVATNVQQGYAIDPQHIMFPTPLEMHPQVVEGARKTGQEAHEVVEALRRGDITGAAAHTAGTVGYGVSTALTPVGGASLQKAGEQFGAGNVRGGLGTTTGIVAPLLLMRPKAPSPAAEVTPRHVEALTGLIEDRAGTVDPHATASAALPTLRETAVRMGVDPAAMEGREAGQAAVKVAEQAVRDVQNEFDTIKKPYENVLVDQRPIAQAYRDAITPEMQANEPRVAAALEKQAKKFEQPATLEQINQFRVRKNNELNAYEKRGTTAQIMSDVETKAHRAATDAAREIEYQTLGRLSTQGADYIRALKAREGALIEAKNGIEKAYNQASGSQGEALSKSVREKVANTYPSPRGVKHMGLREILGPKPIEQFNSRLKQMFSGMGPASELPKYEQVSGPSGPVPAGEEPLPGEDLGEMARRGAPGENPETTAQLAASKERQAEFLRQKRENLQGQRKEVPDKANDIRKELERPKAPEPAISSGLTTANNPSTLATLQDQAAQKLFGKRFEELPQGPQRLEAVREATRLQAAYVKEANAFYTQARAELGAQADPAAVMARARELKMQHAAAGAPPPVTPANPPAKPTLTQKVQAQPLPTLRRVEPPTRMAAGGTESSSGASAATRSAQALAIMTAGKEGRLTPAEMDKKLKQLLGRNGGKTVKRPQAPD